MTEPTSDSVARTAVYASRCAILGVFVEGIRRRNPGAIVNAILTLFATYLPVLLEIRSEVEFRPWQRAYATIAMLAHAVGMLGPYDDVWWWDHLTHTLSATLLGGVVHAASRRRNRDPEPRVLAIVVGLGGIWEILEYIVHAVSRRLGIEPILVHYSRRDTVLDLCFNLVGALLVVAFGDHFLRNFIRRGD